MRNRQPSSYAPATFLGLVFLFVLAALVATLRPAGTAFLLSSDPPTYYFSAAGNDSNSCLSTAQACKTIAKANTFTLRPCDRLLFRGGDTFTTSGSGLQLQQAGTAACPIVTGSYNSGNATISISADNGNAISGTAGYHLLQGLTLSGPGTCVVYCGGIVFDVNGALGDAGSLVLKNITASGFTVCIDIGGGFVGADGYFNGVQILNPNVSNCGQHGIETYGNETEVDDYHVKNLLIDYAVSCDNPGTSAYDLDGATVGGITIKRTQIALIQNLTTCRNGTRGAAGISGVGLQTIQSDQIVVRESQCFDIKMSTHTNNDGMCWDFDASTTNSLFEYLVAQNADGHGLIACQPPTTALPHSGNVARYNLLLNNNQLLTNDGAEMALACGGTIDAFQAYNQTLYSSKENGDLIKVAAGTYTNVQISNQIVDSAAATQLMLNVVGNPSGIAFTGSDWFAGGGSTNKFRWNGVSYTSLANIQAAVPTFEKISGSNVGLTSDPLLVSPGSTSPNGYKLQAGSPMQGIGINLQTQYGIDQGTRDYYGNGIPNHVGTGYNVGAYGG